MVMTSYFQILSLYYVCLIDLFSGQSYHNSISQQIEFLMYSHRETGEHVFTVHQGGLTEEQMRMILKEMGVE